ncbi:uncharacterized protein A4U43_UnF9690 [Asparagus officinalis]|uniref:Uncharacterized protein n=1 Tax=Asparagus officinalis TaxID=4686 RepID=A0A1R3L5N0_ASPOF|nr:uncharacterized protein A4U43_UnF9690 [Asparagus officinalis]
MRELDPATCPTWTPPSTPPTSAPPLSAPSRPSRARPATPSTATTWSSLGTVPVNEASVFIAASAVHRSDAIETYRFVIERGEGVGADLEEGGLRERGVLEGEQGVLREGSRLHMLVQVTHVGAVSNSL